ncbi:protein of unknown function (plasmid) [Cupriavidus taiwanensis]|uniref:Uncharacterized protein n=1 Tax=Cupriavidus taiwanensis TaxID=164546 RepID=A0A375IX13_9BURK|nr:protein of unknown function [Cupriavidus taiwanensis]
MHCGLEKKARRHRGAKISNRDVGNSTKPTNYVGVLSAYSIVRMTVPILAADVRIRDLWPQDP